MSGPKLSRVYFTQRMAVLAALGFASGLPLMLTGRTLKVWARSMGLDLKTVGLLSLVTLPYAFKFVWAPLMDRFVPPMLGRRRGWLALTQMLLLGALAILAFTGPQDPWGNLRRLSAVALDGDWTGYATGNYLGNLWLLGWAALLTAFFSASQDIVADAYRTDILPAEERGAGASVFTTGYRLAMLASGAGAVFLAGWWNWSAVYLLMAGLMGVGLLAVGLASEPETSAQAPVTLRDAVVEPVRAFIARSWLPAALILLFIVVFKLPDYMAGAMTDALLLDIGFSKEEIAIWGLGLGTAVTIPGALVGGIIVEKMGLRRALVVMGVAQALSNGGYLVLALVGRRYATMIAAVGIEYFCMGLVAAGFIAFLMSVCDRRYSATQYALLSSLMGASSALGGAPTGFLVQAVGYPGFFVLTILMGVPGLVLLLFLREKVLAPPTAGNPAGTSGV